MKYAIQDTRVGKITDYDRLVLEIWTDGSIRPEEALTEASKIYRKCLNPLVAYGSPGSEIPAGDLPAPAPSGGDDAPPSATCSRRRSATSRCRSGRATASQAENIETIGDLAREDRGGAPPAPQLRPHEPHRSEGEARRARTAAARRRRHHDDDRRRKKSKTKQKRRRTRGRARRADQPRDDGHGLTPGDGDEIMRHRMRGRRLGRTSEHRKALGMNLLIALVRHHSIRTTLAKAKEYRPKAEKLVTLAKEKNLANIQPRAPRDPRQDPRQAPLRRRRTSLPRPSRRLHEDHAPAEEPAGRRRSGRHLRVRRSAAARGRRRRRDPGRRGRAGPQEGEGQGRSQGEGQKAAAKG